MEAIRVLPGEARTAAVNAFLQRPIATFGAGATQVEAARMASSNRSTLTSLMPSSRPAALEYRATTRAAQPAKDTGVKAASKATARVSIESGPLCIQPDGQRLGISADQGMIGLLPDDFLDGLEQDGVDLNGARPCLPLLPADPASGMLDATWTSPLKFKQVIVE